MTVVSVLIPTHQPHPERLRQTLAALRKQTLPADDWETLLIDNASPVPVNPDFAAAPSNLRLVQELTLGLSCTRRRGLIEARGNLIVFVDDDNVLAPDYLARVVQVFSSHPRLGAAGGKIFPAFEVTPPSWAQEFLPLLALRDLGDVPEITPAPPPRSSARLTYPRAAPVGAGMALRRTAIQAWLDRDATNRSTDRRGGSLTSGGDNDIVFSVLGAGWDVGYFPELTLTHLIPAGRLDPSYLARLNRGIQESWMRVLTRHRANPWPSIAAWTLPLRTAKAWFSYRAWSGPAAHIRWHGACGHFQGRINANSGSAERG